MLRIKEKDGNFTEISLNSEENRKIKDILLDYFHIAIDLEKEKLEKITFYFANKIIGVLKVKNSHYFGSKLISVQRQNIAEFLESFLIKDKDKVNLLITTEALNGIFQRNDLSERLISHIESAKCSSQAKSEIKELVLHTFELKQLLLAEKEKKFNQNINWYFISVLVGYAAYIGLDSYGDTYSTDKPTKNEVLYNLFVYRLIPALAFVFFVAYFHVLKNQEEREFETYSKFLGKHGFSGTLQTLRDVFEITISLDREPPYVKDVVAPTAPASLALFKPFTPGLSENSSVENTLSSARAQDQVSFKSTVVPKEDQQFIKPEKMEITEDEIVPLDEETQRLERKFGISSHWGKGYMSPSSANINKSLDEESMLLKHEWMLLNKSKVEFVVGDIELYKPNNSTNKFLDKKVLFYINDSAVKAEQHEDYCQNVSDRMFIKGKEIWSISPPGLGQRLIGVEVAGPKENGGMRLIYFFKFMKHDEYEKGLNNYAQFVKELRETAYNLLNKNNLKEERAVSVRPGN